MNSCGREGGGRDFDSYSNFGGGREAWPVSQTENGLMRSELNLFKKQQGFGGRGEVNVWMSVLDYSRQTNLEFTSPKQADRADVFSRGGPR